MPDKLVMGYWDCPFCDEDGIKGTVRECPNCGHPRAEETSFYMKSANHDEVVANDEYLTESEAASKGKGEDWECSYCGGLNSVLDATCISCGHVRDSSDSGYAEMRKRSEGKRLSAEARGISKPAEKGLWQRVAEAVGNIPMGAKVAAGLALVLIAAFAIYNAPVEKVFHVTDKSWEAEVEVEHYVYADEDSWELPDDAEEVTTSQEIHHYDQVFDHYEERERAVQEKVQSGSHVEYSYKDNGDGTFTEQSRTVPDYTYETRYETYREPVYRDVPVYATRYHYKAWRWKHKESYSRSGQGGEEPDDDDISEGLAKDERSSFSSRTFFLWGSLDDGDVRAHEVDEERYFSIGIGDDLSVKVTFGGGDIVEFVG